MKVVRSENEVEFIPETEFEKESLRLIANKETIPFWSNVWEQSGNLKFKISKIRSIDISETDNEFH